MPDHRFEDTKMKVPHSEDAEMKYWDSEDDEINQLSGGNALEDEELEDDVSDIKGDKIYHADKNPLKANWRIARRYLQLLNDTRFGYLEGMENNNHRVGIKENLPIVLGKWDQKACQDWEDEQELRKLSESNVSQKS